MTTPTSSRPDVPAAYGIKPANEGKGLLDWAWADERLRGRHIWWLATTRPEGAPHLMPVWAVWMGDGVGFSTGIDSRKAKNIAENPRVSIAPERGVESVIVEGVVETLAPERTKEFVAAYEKEWGLDPTGMGEPILFVRPTKVFGFIDTMDDDGFPNSATRWTF